MIALALIFFKFCLYKTPKKSRLVYIFPTLTLILCASHFSY